MCTQLYVEGLIGGRMAGATPDQLAGYYGIMNTLSQVGKVAMAALLITCSMTSINISMGYTSSEAVAVVTFDDGLKDVIEYALPLLRRWEDRVRAYTVDGRHFFSGMPWRTAGPGAWSGTPRRFRSARTSPNSTAWSARTRRRRWPSTRTSPGCRTG